MRKRLFDKNIKKYNVVINPIDSPSVTATALTATAGTVTTLAGTTAGIDTVNASKALNISGLATATNLTINTQLKPPRAAYKSSGMAYGVFYYTGAYIYVSRSGVWESGALA